MSGAHHLQIRVLPLQSVLGHTAELIGTHINANAYSREIQSRSPYVTFNSTLKYLDKNSTLNFFFEIKNHFPLQSV